MLLTTCPVGHVDGKWNTWWRKEALQCSVDWLVRIIGILWLTKHDKCILKPKSLEANYCHYDDDVGRFDLTHTWLGCAGIYTGSGGGGGCSGWSGYQRSMRVIPDLRASLSPSSAHSTASSSYSSARSSSHSQQRSPYSTLRGTAGPLSLSFLRHTIE